MPDWLADLLFLVYLAVFVSAVVWLVCGGRRREPKWTDRRVQRFERRGRWQKGQGRRKTDKGRTE
jgi:hypothetical protein